MWSRYMNVKVLKELMESNPCTRQEGRGNLAFLGLHSIASVSVLL